MSLINDSIELLYLPNAYAILFVRPLAYTDTHTYSPEKHSCYCLVSGFGCKGNHPVLVEQHTMIYKHKFIHTYIPYSASL